MMAFSCPMAPLFLFIISCSTDPMLSPWRLASALAISEGVAAHRTTGDSPSSDVRRKPGAWSGGPDENGDETRGETRDPKSGLKSGNSPRETKS